MPAELAEAVCDELLARKLRCTWWGNIRFEKGFTRQLTMKMAAAGCVAVAGGLETASDRTLRLMRKGVSLKGARQVMRDLTDAGILVHAYLMYGFPTQTQEETREAEGAVGKLCDEGILHSVYWHHFALTAHSPIAREPDRYGIRLTEETEAIFARNEIPYEPVEEL